MTFGTATLRTPVAKPKGSPRGRTPATHTCGAHGSLTVEQIAKLAGVSARTIRSRVRRGARGEALVVGKFRPLRGPTTPVIGIACRLAIRFPGRVPSVDEIRKVRPMSLAVAYRWQRAWRAALEPKA